MSLLCFYCQSPEHYARECPDRPAAWTCRRCGKPGHWTRDCTAATGPVADSPAATGPVGSESPAPAQGSARPGNEWKTSPLQTRPPQQWAKDVHAHAEKIRRALERAGIVISAPEYQDRRHRRMALEQLAESGWISLTEYRTRLAAIDKAATERTAA